MLYKKIKRNKKKGNHPGEQMTSLQWPLAQVLFISNAKVITKRG
jgi:hypothetical protein